MHMRTHYAGRSHEPTGQLRAAKRPDGVLTRSRGQVAAPGAGRGPPQEKLLFVWGFEAGRGLG